MELEANHMTWINEDIQSDSYGPNFAAFQTLQTVTVLHMSYLPINYLFTMADNSYEKSCRDKHNY